MKEYIKPELTVKSLVQNTDLAVDLADGVYKDEADASAAPWWPDYAN
jgi:hypothetical protein